MAAVALVNVGQDTALLEALLGSWERNQRILLGFLRDLPAGGLEAAALPGSWPIVVQLAHIHHTRVFYVSQAIPALAEGLPALFQGQGKAWRVEHDVERIAAALEASAHAVGAATRQGITEHAVFHGTEIVYDHPMLLLQHLLWHEGYHVGQMMLARKATGQPMSENDAARIMWSHWQREIEPR